VRTRSVRVLSIAGRSRTLEVTGGHVVVRVRDREAPGSNPGPPTIVLNPDSAVIGHQF
jgi:hypothetical protein